MQPASIPSVPARKKRKLQLQAPQDNPDDFSKPVEEHKEDEVWSQKKPDVIKPPPLAGRIPATMNEFENQDVFAGKGKDVPEIDLVSGLLFYNCFTRFGLEHFSFEFSA